MLPLEDEKTLQYTTEASAAEGPNQCKVIAQGTCEGCFATLSHKQL